MNTCACHRKGNRAQQGVAPAAGSGKEETKLSRCWRWLKEEEPPITLVVLILTFIASLVVSWFQYSLLDKQTELTRGQATIAQEQNKITLFEKRYELYEFFSGLKSTAELLADKEAVSSLKELKRKKYGLPGNNTDILVSYIVLVEKVVPKIENTYSNSIENGQLKLFLARSIGIWSETIKKIKFLFHLENKSTQEIDDIDTQLMLTAGDLLENHLRSDVELQRSLDNLVDLLQKTTLPDVMAKALDMTEVSQ